MIYDSLSTPPEPGSPLETMCILVHKYRELAELHKLLALCQVIWSQDDETGDSGRKAFEGFREALMPYISKEMRREEKNIIKIIADEAAKGPLSVTRIARASVANKMKRQAHSIRINPFGTGGGRRW